MITELLEKVNHNIKNEIYDENTKIYTYTNENLKAMFDKYDVKDKKVLTVLASSDQLFTCMYNKAKEIDTFDKSHITYFYYYLRKWLILYKNTLYPSKKFLDTGDIEIYELVKSINPTTYDEKQAQEFWIKYLETNNYQGSKYIFESRYCKGTIPFDKDISIVKEKLNNKLNFSCLDFFNKINISKTYDVIILSNMLEYKESIEKRKIIRDNIERLLNNNGIAICSYKVNNSISKIHIEEVNELTKNRLVLDREFKYYEPLIGEECDLAYSYKKVV